MRELFESLLQHRVQPVNPADFLSYDGGLHGEWKTREGPFCLRSSKLWQGALLRLSPSKWGALF